VLVVSDDVVCLAQLDRTRDSHEPDAKTELCASSLPSSRCGIVTKSPIISPNLDSKPTISRTGFSTLIPRGKHRDRKRPDKPIIRLFSTDKARIQPRQKQVPKKESLDPP
jgi:hypothetical protein